MRGALPLALGFVLAVAMQLAIGPIAGPFAVKLLMDIGINVILAVSLNLVNGFTGQFSIGHAGFMAVGGYVAGAVTYYGSILLWGTPHVQPGWLSSGDVLFVAGCLAGALVAAGAGYIVGLPSLRLRGDYLAIVTLGFGEILRVMLQRTGDVMTSVDDVRNASAVTLATSVGGSLGFSGLPYYTDLFWVYLFVTITVVVALHLKFSSYGRAFLSIRENEIAAEAVGINTTKLKVRAFVLAAAFAGIAGGLFAHEVGTSLNPRELGFQKSFDIVIMVVLGGMGSVSGAVLAAIVLTLLPEALRGFSEFRMPIYALALILMMILRPQGILGLKEIWEAPGVRQTEEGQEGGAPVSALLDVRGIAIAFGGLKAVQDFNLEIPKGALHGLIGPNGAGKTTVFNLLTGVYKPDAGTIRLDGNDLIGLRPHQIAKAGMSRTFQNIRLFPNLSVLDNVRIACHLRGAHALVPTVLRLRKQQAQETAILERSRRLLTLFELDDRRNEEACSLPYGDQRRLEIARALATEPKVVLLDEPAAGMNPKETHALATLIRRLRDEFAMTILLIEHDMALVMEICDRITVLDYGVTIASGTPASVQKDPKVVEAYLGEPMEASSQ